ncbi:MAG: acetyl-CoA C-acyltransferase, partial [Bdellovibrionales bacterium]|nr:acetyl-CoA C-acyltransferase [Bdellovibrionales bacterium]
MKNFPRKVVVVEGLRTPFARIGKELKGFHPADLAFQNLKELILRSKISSEEIDEVIIGNVANLPDAANIARVAALRAGLPQVSAFTVHRNCASSLESIVTGTAKIQSGLAQTIIAGGV